MFIHKFVKFLRPVLHNTGGSKRLKWSKENAKYFSDLFGMTLVESSQYRCANKIPLLTNDQLDMKANLLKRIGISFDDWLKYPVLFKESCTTIEQQYLQLEEAGFSFINASLLSDYRKYKRKRISIFKLHGYLDSQTNVAENFITHLNPKPENIIIDDLTDQSTFTEVHHRVLTQFLIWRLNTTQDNIERFYRVNSFKALKSLRHICENMNLLEALGYTSPEILKHGMLLKFSPLHLKTILDELPSFAGMDTKTALRMYPQILGTSVSRYFNIYDSLKAANIPDKCIQNEMDIFKMNPETLQLRLKEFQSIPELEVLRNSPGILRIIKGYNEARSRQSFLQDVNFKCLTTLLLSKSIDNFKKQIQKGRDITNITEVVALLEKLLSNPGNIIRPNLRKHPYYCYVPLLEIQESCNYLKGKLRFSNDAIVATVQIVLYSREKIANVLELIKNQNLKQRYLKPVQKLNLMLYFLEKEHHFTGNGIWRNVEEGEEGL